jgi:hypothetical protein
MDLDGLREARKLADLLGRMLHDVLAERVVIREKPEWAALVVRAEEALPTLQRLMETAEFEEEKRGG